MQAEQTASGDKTAMRQQIAALAELQELELVVEESDILHRQDAEPQIVEVRQKIEELRARIDPETLTRYDRLRDQGPAVVSEVKGLCTGCRLNVPKGDLQRMRNGNMPWLCPNCSKFILLSD